MKEFEFKLNEKEENAYKKFCEKHKTKCRDYSAEGGQFRISFEPCGLGDVILIKCLVCGKEKNITDFSCW